MTGGQAVTLMASQYNLARMTPVADILIGAVLQPGERAPVLITREMVKSMKKGSILIDLAIDQGGCTETSRPTTLEQPTYVEEGVTHYCVPNITSTVSRTSTKVLSNLAVPYLLQIGELGLQDTLESNPSLGRGVYMHKKNIVRRRVAERFGFPQKDLVP
jgi:alanine dehydrogenase